MSKHIFWLYFAVILAVAAIPTKFLLRGYDYIAYSFLFIACVILLYLYLPSTVCRILTVWLAAGFIYLFIVEYAIVQDAKTDTEATPDYLIVLGAGVEGTRPSRSLNYRINAAYSFLLSHPDCKAVLSGGQGDGEDITEALCMYNELCAKGIDPSRLIMEPCATSTLENLKFSFDLIRAAGVDPDGRTAIVSSSYHLYRAKQMAEALEVTASGVAAYPGWPGLAFNYYIREAFGVTYLWAFGSR